MLLILSDSDDVSTNKVIDWLLFYKIPFFRINGVDSINEVKIYLSNQNSNFSFKVDKKNDFVYFLSYEKLTCFWYRRGYLNIKYRKLLDEGIEENSINSYLEREVKVLSDYIYNKLDCLFSVGKIYDNNLNKLFVLDNAKKIGLNIPNTVVTSKPLKINHELKINKSF